MLVKFHNLEVETNQKVTIPEVVFSNNREVSQDFFNSVIKKYNIKPTSGLTKRVCESMVNKTLKVGTFAGRVRSLVELNNKEITQEEVSKLGIEARFDAYKYNKLSLVKFDLDTELNWQAGDFGDAGSCFFASRSSAKEAIKDHGTVALRLYNNDKGVARVWLTPYEGKWIMWNCYGSTLVRMARLLADVYGLYYKRINFEINEETGGHIFINENGKAYILGWDLDDIETGETINIDMDWDEDVCENCGTSMQVDDVCYINDTSYCEHCFRDIGGVCNHCYEPYYLDDVNNSELGMCLSCLEGSDNYSVCDKCNQWYDLYNLTTVFDTSGSDDLQYCHECKNRHTDYSEFSNNYYLDSCRVVQIEKNGMEITIPLFEVEDALEDGWVEVIPF